MSIISVSVGKAWRRIFRRFHNKLHVHIIGADFEGQTLKKVILLVHHRTGEIVHIDPHKKQIFLRHGHGQLHFPHHPPKDDWEDICIDEKLHEVLVILEKDWGFHSSILDPDSSP